MRSSEPTDPELLAEWLDHQREPAFRSLVARYAGLVHMTAMRTCGDDSIATEATQLTFITLAQKAKSLTACATLGGWLHRTAMMQAKNLARKSERENRKRQQLAMEPHSQSQDETWREMQPVLDDALAALSDKDREALLLRFYRSLTIREIAATLGIATDAAQKRIDRATERLRGKLMRRGVQTGGSLSAVMLAGFAGDAQAALPVSMLASKAIAAGGVGSGLLSTTATIMTAASTKTSSIVIQLVALVAVGIWIAGQRDSIGVLEQQNALLRKAMATGTAVVSIPVKRVATVTTALDKKPIDWEEVARQLRDTAGDEHYLRTNRRLRMRLEEGFRALGFQELISALDEIAGSALSARDRDILEEKLGTLLMEKDPELGMTRFIARIHEGDSDRFMGILTYGLGRWAKSDPARAVAWFDKQIAAGEFETNYSGGDSYTRIHFENRLIFALLSSDPGSAGSRLAAFPEDQRIKVLQDIGVGAMLRRDKDIQRPFADMLRQQLPEKDRLGLIAWPVYDLGEGGTVEYSELKDYLVRIGATPAERESCILSVAARTFPRKSGKWFETTNEDLDTLRVWVTAEAPELADRAIVGALGNLSRNFPYPEAAAFALHCHETSGRDEELLPLLESDHAEENKELARTLAAKLSDAELRGKYLGKFK